MENFVAVCSGFNILSVCLRLVLAAVIGGIIGLERGRHGRAAGLRTHILICIGAAMSSLTGIYISSTFGGNTDVARLSAQVVSGIGFLGAGTILIKNSAVITGLTTAAGIWTTAAIGIAVGYGFYSGAVIAVFIDIFSVTILNRAEHKRKNVTNVYVELTDITDTDKVVEAVRRFENENTACSIIPAKSGCANNIGITFLINNKIDFAILKKHICESDKVAIVIQNIN